MRFIDGHNDTLLNLFLEERGKGRSFFERSVIGHIDLPRALEAEMAAGFFAIFVPAPPEANWVPDNALHITDNGWYVDPAPRVDHQYAVEQTEGTLKLYDELLEDANGQFYQITNHEQLSECIKVEGLGSILHFEGAEAIAPNLSNLEEYYNRGLRSLGIVWSRDNEFACGVPFQFPSTPDTGPGLTRSGFELVKSCNSLGIALDLSHLNEAGFWDVANVSNAPLIVTHTAAWALSRATRNLTDKQIDAVGASGGVIGINLYAGGVRTDGNHEPDTPIANFVEHIDYIANRIGTGGIALGSDFDGALMANEIKDVTGVPKLLMALRKSGWNEENLEKFAWRNWVRVLSDTWKN